MRAFTLIELLVVITIIVVLLSLLTPALDRAIEQAELATCAARLHAWGPAIAQHGLEHNRQILTTPMFGGGSAYPNHAFDRERAGAEADCFALDAIAPYIGISKSSGHQRFVAELFYCPSQGTQANRRNNDLIANDPGAQFLYPDYAYFGGVSRYAAHASNPEQLAGRRLGQAGILMADTIYKWNGGGTFQWYFNHSEVGSSNHAGLGEQAYVGIPPLTGTNQLFADGSARWKDGRDFDTVAMDSGNPGDQDPQATGGYVSAAPGPNPAADLNFY